MSQFARITFNDHSVISQYTTELTDQAVFWKSVGVAGAAMACENLAETIECDSDPIPGQPWVVTIQQGQMNLASNTLAAMLRKGFVEGLITVSDTVPTSNEARLVDLLSKVLGCCELNMDDMEEDTRSIIAEAGAFLAETYRR